MFEVTEKAQEMIRKHLKEKAENHAIRFIVSAG